VTKLKTKDGISASSSQMQKTPSPVRKMRFFSVAGEGFEPPTFGL